MATRTNSLRVLSWWLYEGAREVLTLDTSGNLGLGVVPSAWDSNQRVMQFRNGSANSGYVISDSSSNMGIGTNGYYSGGAWQIKVLLL